MDTPLDEELRYYVVFEGSKLRHATSTKILNPYTLEAIIPGKINVFIVYLFVALIVLFNM